MDLLAFIIMFLISVVTAAISAATGMGGGVVFLVGLNFYFPMKQVIPIHGLIQLKNNIIRTYALRSHLKWEICLPFLVGCAIGVVVVSQLSKLIDSKLIPYCLILALVLYSLFKPKRMPQLKIPNWGFYILGFITGFLGILVGAVDPILAPFFLRDDFTRHHVIANKSFFQSLVHLSKIPVFVYLGFNYLTHWQLILVLFIGGVIGTWFGIKILERINQQVFIKLFKSILFLVSLKLAYNIYHIIN